MPPTSKSQYFRRFLAYTLDYKSLLALAIFMGLAKFAMNYTFPWLIGAAVDHVVKPEDPATTEAQRMHWLWDPVGLGVFFSILHAISSYGRGFYDREARQPHHRRHPPGPVRSPAPASLHFYSKERTGSIVSRLITDIQQASQIVNGGMVSS
jgi:ABC-type multidrug transport system fused ATPase/permease subunit